MEAQILVILYRIFIQKMPDDGPFVNRNLQPKTKI